MTSHTDLARAEAEKLLPWKTTVHVGVYWEGFDFELKRRRWLWSAKFFAWRHLAKFPLRRARIIRIGSET